MAEALSREGAAARSRSPCRSAARRPSWSAARAQRPRKPRPQHGRERRRRRKLLDGLAEAFDLDAPPRRIEVYDNSHIQGTNAVGAMIVAGPEGFLKASTASSTSAATT